MPSALTQPPVAGWLVENGPRELESLFRAIVYHPSAPILIADNDRHYRDASSGAGKLLGLSREKIIGRSLDDFVEPSFKPQISELWQAFLQQGEQEGTLRLVALDGSPREVQYTAKGNVLPVRHLLLLRDKTVPAEPERPVEAARGDIPAWVQDYALFLLNVDGNVVAWYSGAERIYGYPGAEAIGQHVALLYPSEDTLRARLREELTRSAAEGHFGTEAWCVRKDGARFWANVITMPLARRARGVAGLCESGARL
jgi:formate hydrogenlyase transcriptional activator